MASAELWAVTALVFAGTFVWRAVGVIIAAFLSLLSLRLGSSLLATCRRR